MEFPNIQYNGDVSKFVEDKNDPTEVISLYMENPYITIFNILYHLNTQNATMKEGKIPPSYYSRLVIL